MKKCPFCAEEIQDGAIKCKHCGEFLQENKSEEREKINGSIARNKIEEKAGCLPVVANLLLPGLGYMILGLWQPGIIILVLGIVGGIFTCWIAAVILGVVSAIAISGSCIYKCPKCMEIVDANASICKYCQARLELAAQENKAEGKDNINGSIARNKIEEKTGCLPHIFKNEKKVGIVFCIVLVLVFVLLASKNNPSTSSNNSSTSGSDFSEADEDRFYRKVKKYWDNHPELPAVMSDDAKKCIHESGCRRSLELLMEK